MYVRTAVRHAKKAAQTTLVREGLVLPVAFFLLLLTLALVGTLSLFGGVLAWLGADLSLPCKGSLYFLSWGLTLCLLFPFWLGIKQVIYSALFHGRTDFSLVFSFFTGKRRYLYAIGRALRVLGRLSLAFGLLYGIATLGNAVSADLVASHRPALALLVLVISIFFCILTVVTFSHWRSDGFLTDAILFQSTALTHRQANALSVSRMKTGRPLVRRLWLSFLPFWLLSLLLLGIPLFFVIPYYLSARAHLAHALINA